MQNNKLPPNTLTNADGTPYAVCSDSAIDRKKVMAYRLAQAFAQVMYAGFFQPEYAYLNGSWNEDERCHFQRFLMDSLGPGILTFLENLDS